MACRVQLACAAQAKSFVQLTYNLRKDSKACAAIKLHNTTARAGQLMLRPVQLACAAQAISPVQL